jgi:tetratricopeptide (TPR) repeat protein
MIMDNYKNNDKFISGNQPYTSMYKIVSIIYVFVLLISSHVVLGQNNNAINRPDSATMVKMARKKVDSLTIVMKSMPDPRMLAISYIRRGSGNAILGLTDSAINDYTTAITLNPRLVDAYLSRARVYDQQKQYEASIADAERAIPLLKGNSTRLASVYGSIGFGQYKLKNYGKCIEADSIAILLNPNNTQAYANTGWAYLATQKFDKAIEYFTASIAGYGSDKKRASATIIGRADAKRALKKYRDAVNDYTLAIQLNPNDHLAYWNRASCYYLNGDYELAEKDYTKTITYYASDNVNLARLYNNRANMEIAEQKYPEAFRDDSAAITHNLSFGPAYWGMGDAHAQNGDFQLSVVWYTETMKHYTDNASLSTLNNDISNEAYFMGQYEQAIHSSTRAIELDARAWSPYLNRGRAYLKQGKKDQATADFKKVLTLDTTKRSNEYAFALFYTGNGDQAVALMQSVIVSANDPAVLTSHYYNLACLYSLMNKADEANTYLKKCIDGGYSKKYAQTDPDLENIRGTQDFIAMMKAN